MSFPNASEDEVMRETFRASPRKMAIVVGVAFGLVALVARVIFEGGVTGGAILFAVAGGVAFGVLTGAVNAQMQRKPRAGQQ